jgi:hypothetical protein
MQGRQEQQEQQERRIDPGSTVRVLFEAAPSVDQADLCSPSSWRRA